MEWGRKNAIPRTGINPNSIPLGYLAECAYEWDEDGHSTPADFVDALSFETAGRNRDVVSKVLLSLGKQDVE